jgi:hypothetical protein
MLARVPGGVQAGTNACTHLHHHVQQAQLLLAHAACRCSLLCCLLRRPPQLPSPLLPCRGVAGWRGSSGDGARRAAAGRLPPNQAPEHGIGDGHSGYCQGCHSQPLQAALVGGRAPQGQAGEAGHRRCTEGQGAWRWVAAVGGWRGAGAGSRRFVCGCRAARLPLKAITASASALPLLPAGRGGRGRCHPQASHS